MINNDLLKDSFSGEAIIVTVRPIHKRKDPDETEN